MSNPGPDSAPQWQQPPPQAVTGTPMPAAGTDAEPPMWAQPIEAGELVPAPAPVPPAPVERGTRVVNAVFGRAPTLGKAIFSVLCWVALITYFLVRGTPGWVFAAAIAGVGASLINVVRWYLDRR